MFKKQVSGSHSIKITLLLIGMIIYQTSVGQNVKIGATNATPNAAAMLDVDGVTGVGTAYKGILIPRMTYAERTSLTTLAAVAQGLLVYQTDVNGTSLQGFYYNTSLTTTPNWVYLDGTAWDITGNSNVTAASNYIGTNVAQDFVTKTNTTERMRVASGGNVIINNTGIGTNTNDVFSVYATGTTNGSTSDISSIGLDAISGYSSSNGIGVYGEAGGNNLSLGVFGFNTNTSGTGLAGTGNNAGTTQILGTGSGGAFTGTTTGSFNYAGSSGTGVEGVSNGSTPTTLPQGSGVAGTSTAVGVYGYASATPTVGTVTAGGYFGSINGQVAVGASSTGGSFWKVIGTVGSGVSTTVPSGKGDNVVMYCPEAPEVLFEDYGVGTLVNGKSHVTLDSIYSLNIAVNENHPLRIFFTPGGNCNQLFYSNVTAYGFDVTESGNGSSNIPFTYMVVANEADVLMPSGIVSHISDTRFPPAPDFLQFKQVQQKTIATPVQSHSSAEPLKLDK